MSETGATPEQIERAARKALAKQDRDIVVIPSAILRAATLWACDLVQPDERIVSATAVPTAEEVAAIRAIVADDGVPAESAEWFAAFDTLRAYLERQR